MKHRQLKPLWKSGFFAVLAVAMSADVSERARAAGVELSVAVHGNEVEASWTSRSVSASAPFVHYEFQVQRSSNLVTWENVEAPIPGGFLGLAALRHTYQLPATNGQSFVRLTYRLNMPGSDLRGLDLSGADLRGANLAGANLTGARLDGTLLGGADLTGAKLTRGDLRSGESSGRES